MNSLNFSKEAIKFGIESYELTNAKLISNKGDDLIKVVCLSNQEILIIIESMHQSYKIVTNQVAKGIQYRMLQTISHELGTYLNYIYSSLQACNYEDRIPEDIKREILDLCLYNFELVKLLLQDFRDYQDILNDNLKIKIVEVDIINWVNETLNLFTQQALDKRVKIKKELSSQVPQIVYIDKIKYQQIIVNLISNSLKFSPQESEIKIFLEYEQGNLIFKIKDEGIGMSNQEIEKLIKLLKGDQCDERISINSSGYGFGLTVSNKLVCKLNKDQINQGIFFKSEQDKGSLFWFQINVQSNENQFKQQKRMVPNLLTTSIYNLNDFEYIQIESKSPHSSQKQNQGVKQFQYSTCIKANKGQVVDSVVLDDRYHYCLADNVKNKLKSFEDKISVQKANNFFNESMILSPYFNKQQDTNRSKINQIKEQISDSNKKQDNISFADLQVANSDQQNKNNQLKHQFAKKQETKIQINQIQQKEEERMPSFDQMNYSQNIDNNSQQQCCSQIELPYILIVDDTQTNHSSLQIFLNKIFKFPIEQILNAYNGKEGIQILMRNINKIQVIFMDLNMPVMDGFTATKNIRQIFQENNYKHNLKIIAYTAYSDPATEQKCLSEGFDYYLCKPVERCKLQQVLIQSNLLTQ